jgi:hypothetical protein
MATDKDLSGIIVRINEAYVEGEKTMRKALSHYRECGKWLAECQAVVPRGEWMKWVESNCKFSPQTAANYIRIAAEWDQISGAKNLHTALCELATPREPVAKVSPVPEVTPHVAHNSGEHEWYTPDTYLDAARIVLGSIDLDPASSDIAQERVRAGVYYTKENDGLSQEWRGNVWLNPPYESGLIEKFIDKLCLHFDDGSVQSGVVLVNNATETGWFQQVAQRSSAVCFPEKRVKSLDPAGHPGAPLQGQAVLYLGPESDRFQSSFESFGLVFRR